MADANATAAPKSTNVQVAVRCRPLNAEEKKTGQPCVIACNSESKSIQVSYGPAGKKTNKAFAFDRVFGLYSSQEEVFEQFCRPIVDETLAGFNCTIFAYGQTGTGKTHTMEGDINSEENAGIVPRSVKAILEQLEASGSEFTIRVSFLELYNEELQDLLNTSGEKKLKLCEDLKKGVVCQNLEEITVLSVNDIFEILQRGIQQRQTAATLCNKNSSRSHSIFTMKIMIKECNVDGEEVVRNGQLNLVDLAGSECIGRSGAKNDRAREAGSINQSLLTLGRVITALVDHHGHIPYRDSKLTRLLQESLGGKAKTCIIATLSPSQLAVEESLSTLDYAFRARNIKNLPTLNQRMTKKVVLKEYCAEIESLKAQLQITREKNGVYVDPAEFYSMENRISAQEVQLSECEAALKSKTEEVKYLRGERESLVEELDGKRVELEEMAAKYDQLLDENNRTKSRLEAAELDLKAEQAVVLEQRTTEGRLRQQGVSLQDELQTRRDEISRLFSKLESFSQNDSIKRELGAEVAQQLHSAKAQLESKAVAFQAKSGQQSEFLRAGVTNMLDKSRDTCITLRAAIQDALGTLITDSAAAKDSMAQSCDELTRHLQVTNTHIEDTLKAVQQQLSTWLEEVDVEMTQVQSQLGEQQAELDALLVSLTDESGHVSSLTESFAAAQKESSTQSASLVADVKDKIKDSLETLVNDQEAFAQRSAQLLSSQCEALEQTMQKMLKEVLSSAIGAARSSVDGTKTKIEKVDNLCEKELTGVVDSLQRSSEVQNKNYSILSSTVAESIASHIRKSQSIGKRRLDADNHVADISQSVPLQRAHLDETVSALRSDVDKAIAEGCEAVSKTSQTANSILVEVRSAADRMNQSTATAADALTTFLDSEGERVSENVSAHFSALAEHETRQISGLQTADSYVVSFENSMDKNKLVPTGNTPQKTVFTTLPTLAKSRDLDLVRTEARSIDFVLPSPTMSTIPSCSVNVPNNDPAVEMYTVEPGAVAIDVTAVDISTASVQPSKKRASDLDGAEDVATSVTVTTADVVEENVDDGENFDPNAAVMSSAIPVSANAKRGTKLSVGVTSKQRSSKLQKTKSGLVSLWNA